MEQPEPDTVAVENAAYALPRVALLGEFSVAVGARAIEAPSWRLRKASHILKILALVPRHQLHREQVIEMLWPHLDAEAAANNLRVTLHFARRLLEGTEGFGSNVLVWHGDQLSLFPDRAVLVDVEQFERAADHALQSQDPEEYERALGHYRGELLPEDRFEEWAIERRESLRAVQITLLQNLTRLWEERGEHARAIETVRALLQVDPAHEPAAVVLMRLSARTGQRAQALRQYQQLREVLQRELDVEPELETTRLYEAILTGTFDAGDPPAATSVGPAPARSRPATLTVLPRAPRTNLPAQLTSFIGRERDIAATQQALAETRLVTLTGPGGSGKTRLAIEMSGALVETCRDGVWLVDLTSLADDALVAQAVASVLQIQDADGRSADDALVEALASKQMLLVLDNCEHMIEATATLVDRLLRACPELRVLATSREPLRVPGEVVWPVPALEAPDPERLPALGALGDIEAVRLFIDRARLYAPQFRLTNENSAAVAVICHGLDGVPLAIELAAARTRVLPVAQIAERLGDALGLLTTGSRTGPAHHRSLRATIEWSHNLLSAPEQRLLAQLAVFAGGFTIEAAEAVGNDGAAASGTQALPETVLDLLFALVDKSLVIVEDRAGEARYRLLETIRQFASERLTASGGAEGARRRHARYFAALVAEAEPRLLGPDQRLWQTRLAREHDNIRAALDSFQEWHDPAGARMAGSLYMYWWFHGFLSEGLAVCEAFLAWPADALAPRERAWTLATAGLLASWHGQTDLGATRLTQALALWDTLPDQRGAALCYLTLGVMAVDRGDYAAAESALQAGLELARQYDEDAFGAMLHDSLSNLAAYRGAPEQALMHSTHALELAERAGDPGTFAHALINLASIRLRLDDLSGAMADAYRGLALARELGERRPLANVLNLLARIAIAQRSFATAARYSRESLELSRSVSDPMGVIYALSYFAQAIAAGASTQLAVRLTAALYAAREALDAPPRPEDRDRFEPLIAAWRVELGQPAFNEVWAAGQAVSLDAACDEVLAIEFG